MQSNCDWTEVEREYRGTRISAREIARRHGISETAIRKRAKAGGWVRAEPESANRPDMMPERREVAPAQHSDEPAEVSVIVQRGKNLVLRMMDELDSVTSHIGELEDMIERETAGDENPKRRQALYRAVSLGTRSAVAKNLATALKTIQEGGPSQGKKEERQQAAETAANKFAVPQAPKLAVDNTR